jgi:hypothetical protein
MPRFLTSPFPHEGPFIQFGISPEWKPVDRKMECPVPSMIALKDDFALKSSRCPPRPHGQEKRPAQAHMVRGANSLIFHSWVLTNQGNAGKLPLLLGQKPIWPIALKGILREYAKVPIIRVQSRRRLKE